MATVKNMTTGSPLKILFSFTLPLMVGNVFQQLYTLVDSMAVGRVLWHAIALFKQDIITHGFSL